MLMSEFARVTGLSPDTVRFYVRKGLLEPETGRKGGSNPYQIFTAKHADDARLIRLAQSLGFTLKEIAALNAEYKSGRMTPKRNREIMLAQLARLDEKAHHLATMTTYVKAKIAWLERGGKDPEPTLHGAACALEDKPARLPARKPIATIERRRASLRQ